MNADVLATEPASEEVAPEAGARLARWEWVVLAALVAATFVVHNVGYVLSRPFWNDEAWVAVTTRYPLRDLPATTSSTPIGWSYLLRLVVFGGQQRLRLLPLFFAAACVPAGYFLVRALPWPDLRFRRLAATLAGVSVLAAPALAVRNDLKQYTADALVALVVLVATAWAERACTRYRLAVLTGVVIGGMFFSDAAAFTGAASFAGLVAALLLRRAWRPAAESALAGVAAAVGLLIVYEVFYARSVVSGLTAYWRAYYLPVGSGLGASWHYLYIHTQALRGPIGLGPWWIAIPFVLAGVVTLVRLDQVALGLAIPALAIEMMILSAAKKFPLLDERTSTFLMVIAVVVAAIGVLGMSRVLWSRTAVGGAGACALVVALFVVHSSGDFRTRSIPPEDVRSPAAYVAAHLGPADVVLVNLNSNWGFAYYWTKDRPARRSDPVVLQGYVADYPLQDRIVVASNRDLAGVSAALNAALVMARSSPGARIWLVRTHVNPVEARAWLVALSSLHLSPVPVLGSGLELIPVPAVPAT